MTDAWNAQPDAAIPYPYAVVPNPPPQQPPAAPPPGGSDAARGTDRAIAGLESSMDRQRSIFESQQSALAPRYAALSQTLGQPIPQAPRQQPVAPAPKPEEFQKYSLAFAGAMAVLGAVSSRFTRASGQAALASFNGALQGWQQGNLQAYEQSAKQWEQNTRATIENNNQELARYRQVLENRKLNIDQQMAQIQLIAAQHQDAMTFEAAQARNYTMVAQIYSAREHAGAQLQQAQERYSGVRQQQQAKMEQTAAYWLSPEGVARRQIPEGQPGALTQQQQAGIDQLIQHSRQLSGVNDGNSALTDEDLQQLVDRRLAGDKSVTQNMGRGTQGPRNLERYNHALAEAQRSRGISGADLALIDQQYQGGNAYQRRAGTSAANVENATNEVIQLMPLALESSRNLPRGPLVPLNRLIQSYQQGTSDPAYNDFIVKNFGVINAYTRAMNPQGVPRIAERLEQHAIGLLSTATSQQTYEVQLRALWQEVQASQRAVARTAEGRHTPPPEGTPMPQPKARTSIPAGAERPRATNDAGETIEYDSQAGAWVPVR